MSTENDFDKERGIIEKLHSIMTEIKEITELLNKTLNIRNHGVDVSATRARISGKVDDD